ncbi:saccharopine dehydrogenase [Pseudoponticoccus marisrubri]|uniref:Saccharopine dehydrogenase [NAD(+), L-lysine-forming] n=1 Tax=Pseudoponticoccus marisrubri TaxID=1685382 RepID=A0A0W7WK53_9RHOB|nr:saccharopine dehydrogenase [Pseudoponticoccus marisrubri]KUF10997.1 saccharopine dehydrogenase [Pseudoponticoccus marisrubri]
MTHLWIRAESRPNEQRTAILPEGVAQLIAQGMRVTVEESPHRVIPTADYAQAGAEIAAEGSWHDAPRDAIILGLKELPEADTPLPHRHIMFGHAYKGQESGQRLLRRFAAGGGTLYDLEYLEDAQGRRVAAFGYWAGYAGAAVSVLAYAAQATGGICPPVTTWASSEALLDDLRGALGTARPSALVIGALGRVGRGASALCAALELPVTGWDMAETAHGGPFPEVLEHDLFFNCILARPGCPVFVPASAPQMPRRLRVIGDIACDPQSDFSPVKVYDRETDWQSPVTRVFADPPLDVMAIDNLPSLLPLESAQDFAAQLLPHLKTLDDLDAGVWGRARVYYETHKPKEQP